PGSPAPGGRRRLAALVPSSAGAAAGSRRAASPRVITGAGTSPSILSRLGWGWSGTSLPPWPWRLGSGLLVGGHGPQPHPDELVHGLLQRRPARWRSIHPRGGRVRPEHGHAVWRR